MQPPFIDPVSGAISLQDSQAAALLSDGAASTLVWTDILLRALFHEATHQASFAGPVGSAFAALCVGTSESSHLHYMFPPFDDPGVIDLRTRDCVLHSFFESAYGPLLEGLAVFAEFDLYSCNYPYLSHPLYHASGFLSKELGHAVAQVMQGHLLARNYDLAKVLREVSELNEAAINRHLRSLRITDSAVLYKQALLREPLLRPNEARKRRYLLGYLASKRTYLQMRRVHTALNRSNIFHLLMQAHFFWDNYLSEALVSLDMHTVALAERVESLVQHVQDQWNLLYERPCELHKFLQQSLGPDLSAAASPRLKFLTDLRVVDEEMHPFKPRFLKHRLILRYSATRVFVKTSHDGQQASVYSSESRELLGEAPMTDSSDRGEFIGTVELVRSYDASIEALVVLGPNGLVSCRCLRSGQWNLEEQVKGFDDLPSLESVRRALDRRQAGELGFRRYPDDLRRLLDELETRGDEVSDHLYVQLAFPIRDRVRRMRIAELLSQSGFEAIYPNDLHTLATFSIVFGGEGVTLDEGSEVLGRPLPSVEHTLKDFNAVAEEYLGVTIFEFGEDAVVTSAI